MAQSTFIHGAQMHGLTKYTKIVIVTKILDDFEGVYHVWLRKETDEVFVVLNAKKEPLFRINIESDVVYNIEDSSTLNQ